MIKRVLTLVVLSLGWGAAAQAVPFTSIVVYGESLSDNGNLFAATGQPGMRCFQGRRSNGPVAVEQLASSLGSPLRDFAWIGSTTGAGNYGDGGTPTNPGAFHLPGMQLELAGTQGSLGPNLVLLRNPPNQAEGRQTIVAIAFPDETFFKNAKDLNAQNCDQMGGGFVNCLLNLWIGNSTSVLAGNTNCEPILQALQPSDSEPDLFDSGNQLILFDL